MLKIVLLFSLVSTVLCRSYFSRPFSFLFSSKAASSDSVKGELNKECLPYDFKIFTEGEKELTMNCLTIAPSQLRSHEIQAMRENLFHVLRKFRSKMGFGRAIAAPQLGYPFRIIALHYNNTDVTLYNPVIIDHSSETFTMWDDCFSFPDKMVCVRRYKTISVQFVNEKNEVVVWNNCDQDLSELLQHEIDHLHGVLALSKAVPPNRGENPPAAIVPRDDWLQRTSYYNQFVDFHY
jgi:peptide deformylase